ncbi:MAG TPA: ATP-binding protein [Ohtaekwangia sp.]|nr:ATP-binding protein [Ohtaekwangia sp.]
MQYVKKKLHPHSVKGKILAGFLLAFAAILLAFTITNYAFKDMLGTVEDLSEPSEKLTRLNRVFQEITRLDQLQRAEAIKNPQKPYNAFLNQSQVTIAMTDSLRLLDWDPKQLQRIESMKNILKDRDSLFFSYLKLKSNLIDNKSLTRRIDTLSTIIEQKKLQIDTSVVTTERRTTTTFVHDTIEEKDDRSFIGKIFGKKKKETEPSVQVKVQEELSVSVDTLAIAKQNQALEEVEKIVQHLEVDQRLQNKRLLSRELQLINTNSLLINQLLSILHEVETQELKLMQKKSIDAGIVVNSNIKRISILLLAFFLGAAVLVYLIWIDISKSNFYKDQLEKARDEAEELSQIKQRFLANMSHEIRTPLQSIIGFAEQIKQKQSVDREAVDAIYSSSEHLLHIVNEVLDYSRISSGNLTFAHDKFRLMEVIHEIESAMRIQTERKQLTLVIDSEQATDYTLTGDSFRLRQVLYNVLGNAVKFTTTGFVKLAVKTKAANEKVHCEFQITDTGIGIEKDDIHKIFNQFEQANTSIERHFGGTGLGLTIVKTLVEAQGGNLQVASEPGHGSTFTISLTFETSIGEIGHDELPAAVAEYQPFTGKVLVVDDDPMILRLCGLILAKNEVNHTLYHDSEALLHADADDDVEVILMDIRMPRVSGIELCKALRKKYSEKTKFVALTAHVFPQDKQLLYEQGFDVVLSKPFHEEDLLSLLGISSRAKQKPELNAQAYVVDLTPLRQMTLHDESLFQSVLQQFIEETQQDLSDLNEKLNEKNNVAIREIVHKLAGRVGQIGILPLSLKLRQIETKIEEGETLDAIFLPLVNVRKEVDQLLATVQSMSLEKSNS